jgi:hypothetical protein
MFVTFDASPAETVPSTGSTSSALNQPFDPAVGDGNETVTLGGVVSLGAGAHAPVSLIVADTSIVAGRLIVFPFVLSPLAAYVTDPEKAPAVDPATSVTFDETASLSVLLARPVQFEGSVIVVESIDALSPVPETDCTDTVTVALFLNVFVPVALPFRLIATSA